MDSRMKLSTALRQQQTLAPMQLQFVRMLEMNSAEVEDEVMRMVDDNPALEIAEPAHDEASDEQKEFGESADQLQLADYGSEEEIPSYRLGVNNRSADDIHYEPVATASAQSLYDYLISQLSEDASLTPRQMEIARFIVGNIDSNGYLEQTPASMADDLAITEGIDVDSSEMRNVLDRVRSLDPAGIGAIDLRDSLLLQLRRRPASPDVEMATEIVRDYFDLFSLMHFDRIASMMGVDRERLKKAVEVIRTLNPKPGALISGDDDERTRHITPDFYIEPEGDRLVLTMPGRIPRLQIEQSFAADAPALKRQPGADEANAFIRQKRDEARTFMKVVEMRRETLFRVMSAIMQWQREFFMTGDRTRLRPLVLKDISAVTGDDLSVISRATTGKYVATPQGIFSLKSLFNEHRPGDDDSTSETVTQRLREIIEAEDKKNPLSDEAITRLLTDEGLVIARRTVAKYRERLGIPVGRLRRKI